MKIYVKRVHEGAVLPVKAYPDDAGIDLSACEETILPGGTVTPVRTGLVMAVPDGWYLQIQSRSGHAKRGIVVVGGVLDSGYRGESIVLLYNTNIDSRIVKKSDRIAQGILHVVPRVDVIEVDELNSDTLRSTNGLGSTGDS